ncbi:MAG: pyridoxal phosphate-dependent aminotransferase [Planctomycetota bacterium]|nr:pyridoxal phosphate-dependent aminotransferase [Planctomycetota bacterium]
MQLSHRATSVTESATLAVAAKAAALRRSGCDVIGFGAGQPDFDTPERIKDVAKKALDDGLTGYAKPTSGIPEARAAVCEKLKRDNNLTYRPEQTIITVGGKEALFLACAALLDPGDEVILPAPYWVSFPEQVKLCGAKAVILTPPDSDDLRVTPQQFADALTPKTKVVIFNSPSNPGGFAYNPDETRAVAAALTGRDLVVFSDEMYDRLRYGERREHQSFAAVSDEWYEKTLTLNAASKSYAMTGWRAGYAAGPETIIKAMCRIQSHTTSGAATFVQHALVEALTGDQSDVETMRVAFEERGNHMHARLNDLRGVRCIKPDGAFYCFPDVSGAYARLGVNSSQEFCAAVLEKAHVALVPGAAFGMDTHVRLSFANSMEHIDTGLDRLVELLGTEQLPK